MEWDDDNREALRGLRDGDITSLVDLLEDIGKNLHPEVRLWLASMLKDGPDTPYWRLSVTGTRGAPRADNSERDLVVGYQIHKLWHGGLTMAQAKEQLAEELKLGRRSIDDMWIIYRNVYFRFVAEGDEPFSELRRLRSPKSIRL